MRGSSRAFGSRGYAMAPVGAPLSGRGGTWRAQRDRCAVAECAAGATRLLMWLGQLLFRL